MSWKQSFSTAVKHFRKGELKDALKGFNEAVENGGDKEYIIYDSRAVVLEKLGRLKDALKDARKAIEVAPDQWQGYARSARLFLQAHKFDYALQMADAALRKVKDEDAKRRGELFALKNKISVEQEEYIKRTTNHWAHFPVELFAEISQMLVDEDPNHVFPLSQVCKDWRTVIWSNPSLWTTLVIGRARPLTKARRWIKHANGNIHTLKVQSAACEKGGWDGEGLEGLRWDQLRVCMLENWDIRKLWMSQADVAPLNSLIHYEYHNTDTHIITAPFDVSWPLQHLHLSNVIMPVKMVDMSERNLLTLSLHSVEGPGAYRVKLPQTLESFDVDRPAMWIDELPTQFPNLRHLKMRRAGLWLDDFLAITMPRLETLEIDGCSGSLTPTLAHLGSHSSGLLTSLILKSIPLSSQGCEHLITLLRNNPYITTLHLSRTQNLVSLVDGLAIPCSLTASSGASTASAGPPSILCPMLSHLDLSHCNGMKTGPLVQLIRDRTALAAAGDGQKISTLIVDGCDQLDVAWLPWFRSNVERFSCTLWTKKAGKFRAAN